MLYIAKHSRINGPIENINTQVIINTITWGNTNKIPLCVNFNLWVIGNVVSTGIDYPEDTVDITQLPNDRILVCAKNPAAFKFCIQNGIHCYYDTESDFTLTNRGLPLSMGASILPGSIVMNPEAAMPPFEDVEGICSEYILGYIPTDKEED